jgi:hypothetical protein
MNVINYTTPPPPTPSPLEGEGKGEGESQIITLKIACIIRGEN